MAMARTPADAARSRYNAAFTSSIFEPTQSNGSAFVPAGKRRDQTTSELFGSYDEKDLRGMPKTFTPKDDALNARQKKLHFLTSEVLPIAQRPNTAPEQPTRIPRNPYAEEEDDDQVDTTKQRHMELSSKLFGRQTPSYDDEQAPSRAGTRLTPNDFKWHSHPEAVRGPGPGDSMSHSDRAYHEKCSKLFGHEPPPRAREMFADEEEQQARREEELSEMKRRHNAHYSDLFERRTPMDLPEQQDDRGVRRPRHCGTHEDQIIVHQDWTDSKTELMSGARTQRPEHPQLRKSDELHQTRIFGGSSAWQPAERLDSVTHDNSHKLKSTFGQTTQQIHQAHLRTSITPSEFYEEAQGIKEWEVVELHIAGLPLDADDASVKSLCQGFDLHIVKAVAEMDPVRNLCKGRAKIIVRYNPTRDSVAGLVHKLEANHLRVDV